MEAITVEEACAQRGLRLNQLAAAAAVSYPHLSRVKCGLQELSPAIAARLAEVLRVPPESLLLGQAELHLQRVAEIRQVPAVAAGAGAK